VSGAPCPTAGIEPPCAVGCAPGVVPARWPARGVGYRSARGGSPRLAGGCLLGGSGAQDVSVQRSSERERRLGRFPPARGVKKPDRIGERWLGR
jgi:hypothetical protein